MRTHVLAGLSICFFCFITNTVAQIPAQGARAIPTEIENTERRVSQITLCAERHFKTGKDWLKKKQPGKARQEFDRAIDCIIESGFDVRYNQTLQTFYLELVERIYREEVPLRGPTGDARRTESTGFQDQKFVANPKDELSKPIRRQETKSVRASSNADRLPDLRDEFLSSVEEYKASLKRLLAVYENSFGRAEERFARSKQLYSNGMIDKTQLDDAARSVEVEREKVLSTKKQIFNADNQATMLLLESKQQARALSVGPIPPQLANGQVPAVIRYLNDHLNDPYSMRLLKWSKLRILYKYDKPFWYVTLRMRAKNGFGAYVLREAGFYLKNNKVVFTDNL